MRKSLPDTGESWEDLDRAMTEIAKSDIDWRRGRVPIGVIYATDDAYEVSRKAFLKFFTESTSLAGRAFPSIRSMEEDVLDMGLGLLNAPPDARGSMTTGGSESIILAVKACRDWARAVRTRAGRLNVVVPHSAHPAFNKACGLLDLEERRIPTADDLRADVEAMAAAADHQTILVAGSVPCFSYGVVDPIADLGRLAVERDLWLHVDACNGGYFAPFVKHLGYPVPDFDFSVPGVRSISADLHKLAYAAKPASTVFYRSPDDFERQLFEFDDWPSGRTVSPNLSNTRAGGAVAAAWAVMHHLGEKGYLEIAARMMTMVRAYADGINAITGLLVCGRPDLSIVTFGSRRHDIYAVAERMTARGWMASLVRSPPAIHMMMTLIHEPVRDEYLADLAAAVEEAKSGLGSGEAMRATY